MKTDICLSCPTGKEIHPISELCKDRSLKRGYKKLCKACNTKKCKAYWRRTVRENTDNIYATGVDPEVREAIMDLEMPVWKERFEVIKRYKLNIEDDSDSDNIERVLALHGLS
jgi:hypothetical protein